MLDGHIIERMERERREQEQERQRPHAPRPHAPRPLVGYTVEQEEPPQERGVVTIDLTIDFTI